MKVFICLFALVSLVGSFTCHAAPVDAFCDKAYAMSEGGSFLIGLYCSNGSLDGPPDGTKTNGIVSIHGSNRDGDNYLSRVEAAGELTDGVVYDDTIIISPQFLTEEDVDELNPTQQLECLYWGSGGWKVGDLSRDAPYVRAFRVSSFACMDFMIESMIRKYPNLEKITIIGHSAGGQFVHRYAAGGSAEDLQEASGIDFHYVVTNPSSYLYFSDKRAQSGTDDQFSIPDEDTHIYSVVECPNYNSYRYGLDNLNNYMSNVGAAQLEQNYDSRSVTVFLGDRDNNRDEGLDTGCQADLQGNNRLERGLTFFNHALQEFGEQIMARQNVKIAPGIGHTSYGMFTSPCGLLLLFGYDPTGVACPDESFGSPAGSKTSRKCGLFGLGLFCPFTLCGFFGRLFGLCGLF